MVNKMENRIRVGVLIFKDGKILLVKHVHPETNFTWWVPPGGGLQGNETIFECAKREVREETGLSVELGKIAYIRQFIYNEFNQNNIDIYIIATTSKGTENLKNIKGKGADEHFIKELKYFSEEEIKSIIVYPEILKNQLWKDYKEGFKEIKFIGVEKDD